MIEQHALRLNGLSSPPYETSLGTETGAVFGVPILLPTHNAFAAYESEAQSCKFRP
jgi:hypothetical protein